MKSLVLLAVSALSAGGSIARAQDVVAVLSAGSGPYQAAYESFSKDFGRTAASFLLPDEKPATNAGTRVIVAFGGEAATQPYPKHVVLIVCLAPGLPTRSPHGGAFSFVAMKPPADVLLGRLRSLQPGLKRLAVLWNSDETRDYLKDLKRAAAALKMGILETRVAGPESVPDALRSINGAADALWLAPDPNLVTPETFQTIKQFSWDNAVPFYAPTAGLAAAGAAASVSISAQEAGRQAAELARLALSKGRMLETVYPGKSELVVNVGSAAKAGLKIPAEALEGADKVIR